MTDRQRVGPSVTILLLAIGVVGGVAAYQTAPVLWLLTPAIALLVLRAALREERLSAAGVDIRGFPPVLRERVRSAFAQLPPGAARSLLLDVVNQARLVYARGDSRFDVAEENQLREHVTGLVDACCTTAGDLARLDQFASTAAEGAAARADLVGRAGKASELFRARLTNAAVALAELYTSNVERGTPSTDRVAELTAEIGSDASARSAATQEMDRLLGEQ